MDILILKLILAPLIIGSASLAGRRWGSAVSGWIVGMPITSGPIVFILALSHNAPFAASAALGVLSGGLSLVAHSLAYSWLATRWRWPAALAVSLTVFASLTLLLQTITFPLLIAFLAVSAAILIGLRLLPKEGPASAEGASLGRWEIPVRILIGTSFILLVTGIAPFIGPRLSGLLATIPLYVTILAVFTHRQQRPAAVAHLFRGLLYGMFAFVGFFVTLGILLPQTSLAIAFISATCMTLAIQGCSLMVLRRMHQ